MNIFWQILKRDVLLWIGAKGGLLQLLSLFIIIVTLFVLGVGTGANVLPEISGVVILVIIMLLSTISIPSYFDDDLEDGTLEQYLILPIATSLLVLSKMLSNWLKTSLPLVLAAPFLALAMGAGYEVARTLVVLLLVATPTISAISCMGAALSIGARKSSTLYSVLVLPLYVPILIFASGGFVESAALVVLSALFFLLFPISLLVSAYSIKFNIN